MLCGLVDGDTRAIAGRYHVLLSDKVYLWVTQNEECIPKGGRARERERKKQWFHNHRHFIFSVEDQVCGLSSMSHS